MRTKIRATFTIILALIITSVKAQTTAMQFTGVDCAGNPVNLFSDLDAGKVVILHFFMPSCGSCPPPAQKIKAMADHINAIYPGKVKGYAFPYENVTTCSYTSTWVSANSLSPFYTPMDSGASQVAYYGGFGMPTIVMLGGTDHKVMFTTMSFSTSDTTIMRDKIYALINGTTGTDKLAVPAASFSVYPNPAADHITVSFEVKEQTDVLLDVTDMAGKQLAVLMNEKQNGKVLKQFNTEVLPDGIYLVRMVVNGQTTTQKVHIMH